MEDHPLLFFYSLLISLTMTHIPQEESTYFPNGKINHVTDLSYLSYQCIAGLLTITFHQISVFISYSNFLSMYFVTCLYPVGNLEAFSLIKLYM